MDAKLPRGYSRKRITVRELLDHSKEREVKECYDDTEAQVVTFTDRTRIVIEVDEDNCYYAWDTGALGMWLDVPTDEGERT